jgi:hypothetical protein
MNDLQRLDNHPLQGNVMGIESGLSVRIHKILAELLHSTELELGKLHQTRMDSDRAFVLELLRGLLTSRDVLWP